MNKTLVSVHQERILYQYRDDFQILMDTYEVSTKAYYDFKNSRITNHGWADYFNEIIAVNPLDVTKYLQRLQSTKTVQINLRTENAQAILDVLPHREKISHLILHLIGKTDSILDLSGFQQVNILGEIANPFNKVAFELPEMVDVKGGTFWMGNDEYAPHAKAAETPKHLVKFSDFQIGKYPITVAQFAHFIKETGYITQVEKQGWSIVGVRREDCLDYYCKVGCNWRCDVFGQPLTEDKNNHPVIHINWNDVQAYCSWLSKKTNQQYTLPTEAQWEYAAIGGNLAPIDEQGFHYRQYQFSGDDDLDNVGWSITKIEGSDAFDYGAKAIGLLEPNQLGIYDMCGNVWEWCVDFYNENFYASSRNKDVQTNPICTSESENHVVRGGGWYRSTNTCRVTNRSYYDKAYRNFNTGFRVVRNKNLQSDFK